MTFFDDAGDDGGASDDGASEVALIVLRDDEKDRSQHWENVLQQASRVSSASSLQSTGSSGDKDFVVVSSPVDSLQRG